MTHNSNNNREIECIEHNYSSDASSVWADPQMLLHRGSWWRVTWGHTGGLINPRPWRGRCQAGCSNTGGPPLPRKKEPCQKSEFKNIKYIMKIWNVFSCLVLLQGCLLSGPAVCSKSHRTRICIQNNQHQEIVSQRWVKLKKYAYSGPRSRVGFLNTLLESSELKVRF